MQFPKKLTVELPELEREALRQIHKREPDHAPAALIEQLLAVGIASRLAVYKYEPELNDGLGEKDAPEMSSDITVPETVTIHLAREQQECLARTLKSQSPEELERFVTWMFECGLERYSESLHIIDPEGSDDATEAS